MSRRSLWSNRRAALKRARKGAWFVPVSGSFLPCSWQGYATYLPFGAYLIATPYVAWNATASLGLTVLCSVPNWIAAAIAMTWFARQKS